MPQTNSSWISIAASLLIFITFPSLHSTDGWRSATCAAMIPSTPTLTQILPRGVQRGSEHTLQFSGDRLENAEEIFLYNSETGVTVTSVKQVDGKNIEVVINVTADCRLGEHVAQVRTRSGITEFRSFFVGALPTVVESEPNSSLEESQPIELDVTIDGVVTNEDIDYYKFTGEKGQRVSVEIEAIRLGFMFDPAIALLDTNRFEIAASDDTPLLKQDAYFSVILPADGDYFVAVREASFKGSGQSRYRLHVGHFLRPTAAYPAGGKPGETIALKFVDTLQGPEATTNFISQEVLLPDGDASRDELFFIDDKGISPSPVPFRFSPMENIMEAEPNDGWPETSVADLVADSIGVAMNGIIETPKDADCFRFTAKKDTVLHLTCLARAVGSGLDPVVSIHDATKKNLASNDDSGKPDSYLRFQIPADGDYFVRVRDHLYRGQPEFIYRIEIAPASPKLTLGITRNDRYSQLRQTIAVPRGSSFAVLLNADRKDFGGEIELLNDNLPPGITMSAVPMKDNLNSMPVVFTAAIDAPIGGQLVDFRGRKIDPSQTDPTKTITGSFQNLADFVLGEPNNRLYYGCTVDRLAFAVIEPLPFRIEIVEPKVPIVRDGSIKIKVIAHRDEGFDKPINVEFPFRSPGVGTTNRINIPKDKSEIEYPLNANDKAQLGKWPMYAIGFADFGGTAWTSSQLAELEIADPFVKMQFERGSCELGNPTKLYCKIEQLTAFEGAASAEILGVPPHVTVNSPLAFNAESSELSFEVQTTDKSPVGKHNLFCQVTITQNGEPIVSRAGNVELQITKPLPPPKEATEPVNK